MRLWTWVDPGQLHALQSEDIGDLMRVDEHTSRAAHSHGAHELRHRDHARFDVHVSVEQAGHKEASFCVDDLRLFADGVTGVLPYVGDVTVLDGDIGPGEDLPRLHADPLSVLDHQVSRDTPHGDIYQCSCSFCG